MDRYFVPHRYQLFIALGQESWDVQENFCYKISFLKLTLLVLNLSLWAMLKYFAEYFLKTQGRGVELGGGGCSPKLSTGMVHLETQEEEMCGISETFVVNLLRCTV